MPKGFDYGEGPLGWYALVWQNHDPGAEHDMDDDLPSWHLCSSACAAAMFARRAAEGVDEQLQTRE